MKYYMIDEQQLNKINIISNRLYTENRMNGDEMRDAAQALDNIDDIVRQFEIPEKGPITETCECAENSVDHGAGNCFNKPSHKIRTKYGFRYICENCVLSTADVVEEF